MCDTAAEDDPKVAEGAGLVSDGQTSPSVRSPETAELTQTGDGLSGVTLTSYSPLRALYRPWCLVLVLILLVLSLLFSWAVVHLSLGARSKPFRISSSYNQPGDMETATYDPRFTTNCTIRECFASWKCFGFSKQMVWLIFFYFFVMLVETKVFDVINGQTYAYFLIQILFCCICFFN